MDTLVEQHLIELENGDYQYLHGSQPRATQELDERICASSGSNVSKGSVVRLSPETLGGGACRTEIPVEPSTSAPSGTRAPYLHAVAPGNFRSPRATPAASPEVAPSGAATRSARPPDFTRVSAPTCGRINRPEPGRPSRRGVLGLPGLPVSIALPAVKMKAKRKGA
jgi:hypothetical protein